MKPVVASAGVFLLLAVLVGPPSPANAYPRPDFFPTYCNGDGGVVRYKFSDAETTWLGEEKTAVANGFSDLEAVEDYLGIGLVDIAEDVASSTVTVYRDPTPHGNANSAGWTSCLVGTDSIELNSSLTDAQFEHWARHEMGHVLTLHHTGTTDSFGGGMETMATCTDGTTAVALSQDDHGNLIHKHTPLDPPTVTANDGFEQPSPLQWWGTANVATFTYSSTSPHSGAYAARFTPSAFNGYSYQTMNYAAAGGKLVDARTWVRKTASLSTTGTVVLEIWARSVTYASSPSCDYPTGKNQNSRIAVGGWNVVTTQSLTPTTTWAALTESSTYSVGSFDAVDMRIVVKSGVRYTDGTYAQIEIDDARIRDRS